MQINFGKQSSSNNILTIIDASFLKYHNFVVYMETALLIKIIIFSIPIFTAVTCVLIMGLAKHDRLSRSEQTAKKILIIYFIFESWIWLSFILYSFNQPLFIRFIPFFYLVYFMLQVLFYRFIYNLTKPEGEKGFPIYHYLIAIFFFIIFQAWALIIPEEDTSYIADYSSFNTVQNKHVLFSLLNELMKILRVLYAVFYMVLSCNLIYFALQSTGKEGIKRISWLYYTMFVYVITTLFSVSGFFGSLSKSYNELIALPVMLLEASLHLLLLYNIIHGNVLLRVSDIEKREQLNKAKFEEYMQRRKPYLNPDFKLMELETVFYTNRNYISAFINNSYGMNFNRLVNRYRLSEFEELTQMEECRNKTIAQRALMAGFGSYNNYLRAKQQESNPSNESL